MSTIIPAPPPDASATLRGVVNTSAQTFAGLKTFNGGIVTSEIDAIGALGIGLASSTTSIGIGQASTITTIAYTANTYHNFSAPNIYFHREITASVGTPLLNSMAVNIRGNYWTGSASAPYDVILKTVVDTTTPTGHLLINIGSANYIFDSAGIMSPGNGTNTGQIGYTTGRFFEGHFATTFSDTFDRDTAGTLNIGTGLTNGINLGSANINVFIGGQSTGTGSTRTVNPFYNINTTPATAGVPLVNSNFNYWQGNYWTGTTSNGYFGAIRVVVDTVTPTGYIQFALGQPSVSEVARLNSAGNLLFTGAGVGIDVTTGTQLNIGTTNAASILQGNAAMTTMTLQAKTIVLVSTDAANGGYPRTNTTNLFTGGAAIFGVYNAGTLKTYVDNNGSVVSPTAGANGGYILSAAGQLYGYPAAADTAGVTFSVQGGPSGAVVAAAGKPAGSAQLIGQTGPAGTAGLAAGDGGNAWIIGGTAGTNNGGGGANGGYVYIRPGAATGAGTNGVIAFLDTASVSRGYINPGGVTWLYPQDDITRTLGGPTNRWLNVYTTNVNSGAALTNTIGLSVTTGVADGASSVGTVINNTTSLATVSARILSIRNAGTEKFGFSATGGLVIAAPQAGQDSLSIAGSSGGVLEIIDSGGSPSAFKVTSLVGGQQFAFQFANSGGFKFFGDATASVNNHIVEIDGFSNQNNSLLLVKLGATPAMPQAIELQDSTGRQLWMTNVLGGMLLNASTDATAGVQTQSAAAFTWQGSYWNGSAATAYQITMQGVLDSAAGGVPTAHMQLSLNGVTKYTFDQAGTFTAKAVQSQQNSISSTVAQRKTKDFNGVTRWGCDASGLPSLGSVTYLTETWAGTSASSTTSGKLPGAAAFSVSVLGASTGARWRNDDSTRAINNTIGLDPGGTNGNLCAVFTTEEIITPVNETTAMFVWECSASFTSYSLATSTGVFGLFNTLSVTHPFGFGFIFRSTDSQWQYFTDNGTTMVVAPTGFTPTANRLVRFRIEYFGAGTYKGTKTVNFYVNGSLVGTLTGAAVTGDTPAGGLAMGAIASNVVGGGSPWICMGQTSFWATTEPSPYSP